MTQPANTALYSDIVKSAVPPWSLRQMETLESRVGFVQQVHTAATAIIDQTGGIDVQFLGNLLLTLADTKSLSYLCSLQDTSAPGAKGSLLNARGVKELIAGVAKRSILKIVSWEELEVYLLLVDIQPDNVYEWYQNTFRKLSHYPEVITSSDLNQLVSHLKENRNLLQFIPTSTIQSYIILSGCLELLEGFDKFTLDLNDKDPYDVWLSKIAAIASYQEQRFFVDDDAEAITGLPGSQDTELAADTIEIAPGEPGPELDMITSLSPHQHLEGQEVESQTHSTPEIHNEHIIPGDLVYVDASLFSGSVDALRPLQTSPTVQALLGPYKVLEELPGDLYELEIPEELGGVVEFEKKSLVKAMSYKAPMSALELDMLPREVRHGAFPTSMSPSYTSTREQGSEIVSRESPKVEGSQVLNVRKRSNGYRVNLKSSTGRMFFESLEKVKETKEWMRYVASHPIIPEKISKMEEIEEDDDMEE